MLVEASFKPDDERRGLSLRKAWYVSSDMRVRIEGCSVKNPSSRTARPSALPGHAPHWLPHILLNRIFDVIAYGFHNQFKRHRPHGNLPVHGRRLHTA